MNARSNPKSCMVLYPDNSISLDIVMQKVILVNLLKIQYVSCVYASGKLESSAFRSVFPEFK